VADLDFLTSNWFKAPETVADMAASPDAAAPAAEDAVAAPAVTAPAINVLLLGTDARPDEMGAPRTDTMILLSLDPQQQTAGMLSLPRDLWVSIPGFGYETKINTAYAIGEESRYPGGGAQLAKDTVSSFVGQPVQYYTRVNFQGFVELVDLIGGVDVVVPETIVDEAYPTDDYTTTVFYLEAGTQHLDGETALKYVRTRNIDDDYGRAGRQQQVIRAVAEKVLRADMLPTLLPAIPRLLTTMRNSVETDIPFSVQLEIANYVRSTSLREIRQLVLDNRFGEETYSEEGAWILRPDRTKVRSALAGFFAPPAGDAGSVALADPTWVRIEILNGTGEPGVAAVTRDMLQAQGWQVVSIGDADRSDYGRTIIINYGVPEDLVEKVGVDLELDPNLSRLHGLNTAAPVDVRIVVGRDFLDHLPK
jgi:LCP family protein required for cell wall assembly